MYLEIIWPSSAFKMFEMFTVASGSGTLQTMGLSSVFKINLAYLQLQYIHKGCLEDFIFDIE